MSTPKNSVYPTLFKFGKKQKKFGFKKNFWMKKIKGDFLKGDFYGSY